MDMTEASIWCLSEAKAQTPRDVRPEA